MAKNPYRKDYRLVEDFSAKGRVRTSYEYISPPCMFAQGEQAARAQAVRSAVLTAAGWICYIAAMYFESGAMRRLYVALPFAFCGIPLAFLTGHMLALRSVKEPLEVRHMDRLNNRYPQAAFFLALFSVFSLAGELAGCFMELFGEGTAGGAAGLLEGAFQKGEIVFLFGNAFLCLCAAMLLKGSARLKVRQAENCPVR